MLTINHAEIHVTAAEQVGVLLFKRVVSIQLPEAMFNRLADADALLVNLLAASPARAHSFALFMHERLCEYGDSDHANVWEVVLQLCEDLASSKAC